MIDKELVCIVCPVGCRIRVKGEDKENLEVTGNKCPRGDKYGKKELVDPTRVLPTTVQVENGILSRLPVKSSDAIPKPLIFEAMKEIKKVKIKAPVKVGDVIIKNLLDTGIDIVATRNMESR